MDARLASIERARCISVSTYRRDGRAVASPVWFVLDGERILIWTDRSSGKVKRLRNNPRATIAACDSRGKKLGDDLAAEAMLIDASEGPRIQALLNRKYRLLKPVVDFWSWFGIHVMRKPAPEVAYVQFKLI